MCDKACEQMQRPGEIRGGLESAPKSQILVAEVELKAVENFAAVIYHVTNNHGKATRLGWNGRNLHIEGQFPDRHSKMTEPYIFIVNPLQNTKTPWVPSNGDMFATDWALLPENYICHPF